MNKYKNKRTIVDGISFASKREAHRYSELALLETTGKIYGLKVQPRIPLWVNGVKIGHYVADFEYKINGETVIEDVKSPVTKTAVYKLKMKILQTYDPPIVVKEIF
tara:strand:+ start:319 stop:636 length:318 start_codon:yes stop_codon:yes gene_type:complete